MKINILKTTLATTALFTAISCLVQVPAKAFDLDFSHEPNETIYNFRLDTDAKNTDTPQNNLGSYLKGVTSFNVLQKDPTDSQYKLITPPATYFPILTAKKYVAGSINDVNLSTFNVFNTTRDIVQYSFNYQRPNLGLGQETFYIFVANNLGLNSSTDLIESLSGLSKVKDSNILVKAGDNPVGELRDFQISNPNPNPKPEVPPTKKTPESSNLISLLALGTLGVGLTLKPKKESVC
ncbi:MAG: hypothetical protein ACRC2V_01440, partial [Xenococcaceae cyanobacterium]